VYKTQRDAEREVPIVVPLYPANWNFSPRIEFFRENHETPWIARTRARARAIYAPRRLGRHVARAHYTYTM